MAVGTDDFRTSPASDCYAFSMTILEIATLERPFPAFKHEIRAARAAEKGIRPPRPETLSGLPAEVADALWMLLERMWAQDRSKRPTLRGVQTELEQMSSGLRRYTPS